jgi:hypothetical protein
MTPDRRTGAAAQPGRARSPRIIGMRRTAGQATAAPHSSAGPSGPSGPWPGGPPKLAPPTSVTAQNTCPRPPADASTARQARLRAFARAGRPHPKGMAADACAICGGCDRPGAKSFEEATPTQKNLQAWPRRLLGGLMGNA